MPVARAAPFTTKSTLRASSLSWAPRRYAFADVGGAVVVPGGGPFPVGGGSSQPATQRARKNGKTWNERTRLHMGCTSSGGAREPRTSHASRRVERSQTSQGGEWCALGDSNTRPTDS